MRSSLSPRKRSSLSPRKGERGWTSTKKQLVALFVVRPVICCETSLSQKKKERGWTSAKKQLVALDGLVDVADEREGREESDRAEHDEAGVARHCHVSAFRKVDVRLPGKGNSNSHGARPVHLIITMIKWIRTSRLSIKNSLYLRSVLAF